MKEYLEWIGGLFTEFAVAIFLGYLGLCALGVLIVLVVWVLFF